MFGIFGKKKKEELEHLDISDIKDDKPKFESNLNSSDIHITDKLIADVDKLKSSMEANSELRQVYSEKFSRIDEKIGELRNMLVDREKDISRIELASTKAADMVAEVQPEALMMEVKKTDAKVESVKDKLESYHELINTAMNEVKDLQRVVKTFRGVDNVKEMIDDAHKDLVSYEKIKGNVESRADKVEEIYNDFQKKVDELDKINESIKGMHGEVEQYHKDIKNIKEELKEAATKKEFEKFQKSVESMLEGFKAELNDNELRAPLEDVKELVFSLEGELEGIVTEVSKLNRFSKDADERIELIEHARLVKQNSDIEAKATKDEHTDFHKRLVLLEASMKNSGVPQQQGEMVSSGIQKQIDSVKEDHKHLMRMILESMKKINELSEKRK